MAELALLEDVHAVVAEVRSQLLLLRFVRRITPSDGDETMIFVKPRFGAFGEDCCAPVPANGRNEF